MILETGSESDVSVNPTELGQLDAMEKLRAAVPAMSVDLLRACGGAHAEVSHALALSRSGSLFH
jgi:hypothetical protein